MYIRSIRITNIRSIAELEWEVPHSMGAGWHVIIGDNGSGKSSFLRSTALALIGPLEALALRQDWNEWLRAGETEGNILLSLSYDGAMDKFSRTGRQITRYQLPAFLTLTRHSHGEVKLARLKTAPDYDPERYVWGGSSGWFSASYGPFRRFSGGDKDYDRIFYSNPKLSSHISIFGESVALTESLRWLQDLQYKKLEKNPEGQMLASLIPFINQEGFLPHQTRLHYISSQAVTFVDGNDCIVGVENLSDGYRSILSLTFELIRQLARVYGPDKVFDEDDPTKIDLPGVVLIDEVDAHLHPTWQRQVGFWFRKHFPKLQFIVTTHSPLVCQAASVGSVYRLPRPGGEDKGNFVTGIELDRLLYGDVLEAYGTELFGQITRSEEGQHRLQRLAELNVKELFGQLSVSERKEQADLRASIPTAANTTEGTLSGSKP